MPCFLTLRIRQYCVTKLLISIYLLCYGFRFTNMGDKDYHWVITVPAIWVDGAKQFMREAAEMVLK